MDEECDFEDCDCEDCGRKFYIRPSLYTETAQKLRRDAGLCERKWPTRCQSCERNWREWHEKNRW